MESDSSTSSSSRRSIADCVGDMYLEDQLADIYFSFPNEKTVQPIPAHKMILVAKSPVFKAMFCGKLAEKGNTIKITDITVKIFRLMLKHVYTDKLNIGAENVGALLHASQKYQLESLTSDCEKYLRQNLSLHNACTVLQQAADFALFDLANSAHEYVCEHASDIVTSEDFLNLSKDNLRKVLECDGFCTDEILIFKAVMKWVETKLEEEWSSATTPDKRRSQSQSRKRKAEPEPEEKQDKRREILGDILHQIRFCDMNVDEFNEIVIPSGILTAQEQLTFLRMITLNINSKQLPLDAGDFNVYTRCDAKRIMMNNVSRKLPDRAMDTFPKHLRNCIRIHLYSSKPFKIYALNIVPKKGFLCRSSPVKKASVFCQIQGIEFGKKCLMDFTEYANSFLHVERKIEADKEVVIEVVMTENDALMMNKAESNFQTHDCEVPERENWIKQDITSTQEVMVACEGIDIVQDMILYPA